MEPQPMSYNPNQSFNPNQNKPAPVKNKRKLKLFIYAVIILLVCGFVYAKFLSPKSTNPLSSANSQAANISGESQPSPVSQTQMWDKSKVSLPTYPPINSSTDLTDAINTLEIPDFKTDIDNLRTQTDNF